MCRLMHQALAFLVRLYLYEVMTGGENRAGSLSRRLHFRGVALYFGLAC